MPTNLGLIGAGGAQGGQDVLKQMLEERMKAALVAQAQEEKDRQFALDEKKLAAQVESDKGAADERRLARERQDRLDLRQGNVDEGAAVDAAINDSTAKQDMTPLADMYKDSKNPLVKTRLSVLKPEGTSASLPTMDIGSTTQQGDIEGTGAQRGAGVRMLSPKVEPKPQRQRTEMRAIPPPAGKTGKWEVLYDLDTNTPVGQPHEAFYDPPQRPEKLVSIEGPDGKPVLVPESQAAGQKPATPRRSVLGAERVALGFYNRMSEAMRDMDETEDLLSTKDLAIIHESPSWLGLVNNLSLSPEGRRYAQALKKFTEARLRKESGAAIQQSEFANDRDMIAKKIGDDPAVTAQKKATREQTADGLGFQAGQAFEEFYGEPFKRRDTSNSRGQDAPQHAASASNVPQDITDALAGRKAGAVAKVGSPGKPGYEEWKLGADGQITRIK